MSETGMSTWVCDGHVLSVLSSRPEAERRRKSRDLFSTDVIAKDRRVYTHTGGPFRGDRQHFFYATKTYFAAR